jgi:WD40 repeat protein
MTVLMTVLVPASTSVLAGELSLPKAEKPEITIQQGHNQVSHGVTFSPNGKFLASGSEDGIVNIWSVSDGRLVKSLRTNKAGVGSVSSLAFNADGNFLAAEVFSERDGDGVSLWRIADGKLMKDLRAGRVYAVHRRDRLLAERDSEREDEAFLTFSPDGTILVTGSRKGVLNLWRVSDGTLSKSLKAHEGRIDSLAFSNNQKLLCTKCSSEGTAKVWQFPECTLAESRPLPRDNTAGVVVWRDGGFAFAPHDRFGLLSPDGRLGAAVVRKDSAKLWRLSDGKLLINWAGHAQWAFSGDGKRLVTWRPAGETSGPQVDSTIRVWNVTAGKLIKEIVPQQPAIETVTMSGEGDLLLVDGSQWIRVSDGSVLSDVKLNENTICSVAETLLKKHEVLAVSRDGRYVATGGDDRPDQDNPYTVELRSIENGSIAKTFEIPERLVPHESMSMAQRRGAKLADVAFSHDSRFLAFLSTESFELRHLKVWRISDGALVAETEMRSDGAFAVCGSLPEECKEGFSFKTRNEIWRLSRNRLQRIWQGAQIKSVIQMKRYHTNYSQPSLSGDGRFFAFRDPERGTLNIGEISRRSTLMTILGGGHERVYSMGFNSDGRFFASGGEDLTICVRRTSDGGILREIGCNYFVDGDLQKLAFSPDGKWLAAGDWADHSVRIWRLSDGCLVRTLEGRNQRAPSLDFSPNGKFLAAGQIDGTVQIWDMENGRLARTFSRHRHVVQQVAFSPDGKYLASTGLEGTTKLWGVADAKLIKDIENRESRSFMAVFSPDGKALAKQGPGFAINLWRASDGALIISLAGHRHGVSALSFSPDGKLLVSCSNYSEEDGDAKRYRANLWRLSDGSLLKSFAGKGSMKAAFDSDGTLVAVARSEKEIRVLNLHQTKIVKSFASLATSGSTDGVSFHQRVFAVPAEDAIKFWSTRDDNFSETVDRHDISPYINRTSFSRDLRFFAINHNTGDVKIWRTSDGKLVKSIQGDGVPGHHAWDPGPLGIAFSPNNKFLASAGQDGSIKLFGRMFTDNKEQFERVLTLLGSPSGEGIAFTPEGHYTTSPEGSSLVTWVFSGAPGHEAFSFEQFESFFNKPEIIIARLKGDFDAGKKTPPATRPPYIEMPDHLRVKQTPSVSYPLKLSASATDQVKTLRIFVNGKPTSEVPIDAREKNLSLEVPLLPGMNRITAIAYNKDGFSSNPRYVDVLCSRTDLPKPDLYVGSVGISDYSNMPKLDFAHTDAMRFAAELKKSEGQIFGRIYQSVLTNKDVTREKITDILDSLSAIQENDVAIIFMAGHGVQSTKDGAFYFLTHSGSSKEPEKGGLDWKHLSEHLSKIKGRVIVLLDACHSGSISTETIVPNDELARELTRGGRSGVMVFAASKGRQYAAETPEYEGGFGTFAYALCQGLGPRSKEADIDGNGFVEFSELVEFVTRMVHAESNGEQTPWLARRELFGDFPVTKVLSPGRGPR